MVSRMSLTAPKTSPTLVDSPTSARVSESSSSHGTEAPSSRGDTTSIRKRRFALDGTSKCEARGTDLHDIEEVTPNPSADTIATKLSSASNTGSISKRRGYRPLSVRIGEAFSPFSARESKSDVVELKSKVIDSIEDDSDELWRGLELSKKVNWSENLDPHIYNANFVATLTSKREAICAPD